MKNFTQKFIGIFALVFAISFTANAQNPCQSTADAYTVIINQLEATTNEYWQLLEMCESASYANQVYLNNCNSDKAEIQSELNAANQQIISLQSQLNNAFTQADLDAAYAAGAASITPEDGISQADVDAAVDAANESISALQDSLSAAMENAVADATPLDINIPIDLPQGWSMFGYTCLESLDVVEAFSGISDSIEIVKDEWGLAYLPAWGFSAFDNLEFGEGYQIKMLEGVTDFQFCSTIIGFNTDNSDESDSNSLFGAWFIHSVYDLNTSTGVWESVDPYDIGAESIVIDAENVCFGQLSSCLPYFSPDNSNTLQFDEETAWLYSFGNEHIITGEAGNYLFMGENYVYEDGTFDNRFYIYIQP